MRTVVFGGTGDRENVTNVGILVSDGISTVNASLTLPEAELVHADNITMLAVVVNSDNNLHDMRAIATNSSSDVFLLTDYNFLDQVVGQALERLCNK